MKINEIMYVEHEMRKMIPIFMEECKNYVYPKKIFFLKEKENLSRIIDFDNGLGAWCINNKIFFAIQNMKMFEKFSRMPEFGQNPTNRLVEIEEFIDNDKDYLDYMQYIIDNGLSEVDYSLDVLPHEVMHLIGSGDGIIGEGITELRTRQICKKHGIRCAPIMHTKETKFIKMLESFVGTDLLDLTAFSRDNTLLFKKCEELFGSEFFEIYEDMEEQYREYAMDYSIDPIEHYKKYREMDFSKMYDFLKSKKEQLIEI